MKKLLFCLVLVAGLLTLVGSAQAGVVKGSMHDLSTTGTSTRSTAIHLVGATTGTQSQVCRFCHAPHAGSTQAPLWGRTNPTSTFTMYSSPTMVMTIASQPQGVSLACLSCHDGVTALDSFLSVPYGWPPSGVDPNGVVIGKPLTGSHVIGTNLSGEHPISITYDITKDPAFNAAASGKVGTLPLFGTNKDQMECASCHNPHDFTTATPFLRIKNDQSALCLTCHIK